MKIVYTLSIILIQFSYCSSQQNEEKLISTNLYPLINTIFIKIQIGTPRMLIFQTLDQEVDYFWTIYHFWSISRSTTAQILHNTTVNPDINALCIEDILHIGESFEEARTVKFKYKHVADKEVSAQSVCVIGLPFKFKDNAYSIPHTLKANGLIDSLSYSLSLRGQVGGLLSFGGIPSSIIKDMQSGSCKVNNAYSTWGCTLRQVIIQSEGFNGNKSKKKEVFKANDHYAVFQAKQKAITVPLEFYTFIKEKVLEKYISNGKCSEKNNKNDGINSFICEDNVIGLFPTIEFVFDSIKISLPLEKLTEHYTTREKILMINEVKLSNQWVFGFKFILEFQTLYDYDKEKITFYAQSGIEEYLEDIVIDYFSKTLFNVLLILGLILIGGIALLGIVRFKRLTIIKSN